MMAQKIDLLPADDRTNGWSRILPRREPRPPLAGQVRADWVVVGAGFTGLAAARRLAENRPDEKIVLLEAQEVGEGTSGRNSGFAIDLSHDIDPSPEGLEASRRYMRLARAGIDYLGRQVARHGIACGWGRRGRYHAAVSEKGVRQVLRPLARRLDILGEPYRWVDGEALRREIGSPHFTAAIYLPGCMLMNPAALTRGLADSLPENVSLYERTPVVEVDARNGITLATPKGSVYAPRMILAVDSFAERFGFYRGRLLTFAAHASLTRRLTPRERAALGEIDDWGLTPVNGIAGITLRLTPDHRLLVRQNVHFCPGLRQSDERRRRIQRRHKRLLDRRFPMLPKVEMEHTWTGYICVSRNGSPGFGRVAPTVYAAVGQNGFGITQGTISGLLAADMACGEDNPLIADMESLGTPTRLPPRPALDLGVRAWFAWKLLRARAER